GPERHVAACLYESEPSVPQLGLQSVPEPCKRDLNIKFEFGTSQLLSKGKTSFVTSGRNIEGLVLQVGSLALPQPIERLVAEGYWQAFLPISQYAPALQVEEMKQEFSSERLRIVRRQTCCNLSSKPPFPFCELASIASLTPGFHGHPRRAVTRS